MCTPDASVQSSKFICSCRNCLNGKIDHCIESQVTREETVQTMSKRKSKAKAKSPEIDSESETDSDLSEDGSDSDEQEPED